MEQNNLLELSTPATCANCGSPAMKTEHPNVLCDSCRTSFINYPIPLWIKVFAGAILLIFLVAVYKVPGNISTGIHLDKGMTAIGEKKYLTAQKELQKVVDKEPNSFEAQGNLLVAAFYNNDFETMRIVFEKIKNKKVDDDQLVTNINTAIEKAGMYFNTDSINNIAHNYNDDVRSIPEEVLTTYITKNGDDVGALMILASGKAEKENYAGSDSLLKKITDQQPDFIPALRLLSANKRQENKLDESIALCDQMLAINKQDGYALSSKSRTLLKQKKDKEAVKLATEAYDLDNKDAYAMATLILAHHFSGNKKQAEELLKASTKLSDSTSVFYMQFAKDVMSGKEPFRN